jgi:hypothetical protein
MSLSEKSRHVIIIIGRILMFFYVKKYVTNIRRHRAAYIYDIRYTVANKKPLVPELLTYCYGLITEHR